MKEWEKDIRDKLKNYESDPSSDNLFDKVDVPQSENDDRLLLYLLLSGLLLTIAYLGADFYTAQYSEPLSTSNVSDSKIVTERSQSSISSSSNEITSQQKNDAKNETADAPDIISENTNESNKAIQPQYKKNKKNATEGESSDKNNSESKSTKSTIYQSVNEMNEDVESSKMKREETTTLNHPTKSENSEEESDNKSSDIQSKNLLSNQVLLNRKENNSTHPKMNSEKQSDAASNAELETSGKTEIEQGGDEKQHLRKQRKAKEIHQLSGLGLKELNHSEENFLALIPKDEVLNNYPWSLELYGGLVIPQNRWKADDVNTFSSVNDSLTTFIHGYSAGIQASYALGQFVVQVGSEYEQMRYEYERTDEDAEKEIVKNIVDGNNNVIGHDTMNISGSLYRLKTTQYQKLRIPLGLKYKIIDKKFRLGISVTSVFDVWEKQSGLLYDDGDNYDIRVDEKNYLRDGLSLHARTALELGYRLTDRFMVTLTPMYEWDVHGLYTENVDAQLYQNNMRVNVGLKYFIGNAD